MKITLVTFLFEPELGGGSARVVHLLAHELVRAGHQVSVITSAPVRAPLIETIDGIKIFRFFPPNLYWINDKEQQPVSRKIIWQMIDFWNPGVYRQVRDFLLSEQPDVVHVHKLRGLSPAVWAAASSAGVPILAHTFHDFELVSPEGLLRGRVGGWAARRSWQVRPYQVLRARFSKSVHRASAPSNFLLDFHTRSGFFSKALQRVIPNSHGYSLTELEELKKRPTNPGRPLHLLYLGRLVPEKGLDVLCRAFMRSLLMHPEISLDIAGEGPFGAQLISRYGAVNQIRFLGGVYGKAKSELLSQADMLVLPSIVPESFGIVLAESFAHGLPVLASSVGGIPELVVPGDTGFLTTPGSEEELSHNISQAAANVSRLDSMRAACFEAAKRYAADLVTCQYLDFYHG